MKTYYLANVTNHKLDDPIHKTDLRLLQHVAPLCGGLNFLFFFVFIARSQAAACAPRTGAFVSGIRPKGSEDTLPLSLLLSCSEDDGQRLEATSTPDNRQKTIRSHTLTTSSLGTTQ
jgi:hypothetical protein